MNPNSRYRYRLYGVNLESNRRLPLLGAPVDSANPDRCDLTLVASGRVGECAETATYVSETIVTGDRPWLTIYRSESGDLLRFGAGVDFLLGPKTIEYTVAVGVDDNEVQLLFLGAVIAYWLERRGTPVLHASSVVLEGRAIAFLADSQTGKSTLASAFIERGARLLADDLLACRLDAGAVRALPGAASVRLWMDSAGRFATDADGLERVRPELDKRRLSLDGPDRHHAAEAPVTALYLLNRETQHDAPIRIERLSPMHATIALIRRSYLGRVTPSLGLDNARLDALSALAMRVRVMELHYPTGYERLGDAVDAVLRDLAGHTGH